MPRSVRIGVTGKLGSGKSVLIHMMEAHGFTVIRTDELAREMMERDVPLRTQLIEVLGTKAYSEEKLDRAYIASRIFEDNSLLKKVESAVHPAVTKEVEKVFEMQPGGVVAVESALILRTRFKEIFDFIVLIDAPEMASIERVVKEGRISAQDAEARLREQEIDENSRADADFIIENDSSKEQFEIRCRTMIDLLDSLQKIELPEKALHQST